MSELKPCPICGSELKIYGPEDWKPTFYDPDSGGEPYRAYCDCGFEFTIGSCEWEEFEKALNRRAEPSGKAEQLNEPLTLSEVKEHLSKRHPHEIEPLYVMFDPPMPLNYAPRWRDAYNLLGMVEVAADDYGKTWLAYRNRPESEEK